MNKPESSSSRRALAVWLVALILFLICLGWVVLSGSSPLERAVPTVAGQTSSTAPVMEMVSVLDDLPAPGAVRPPGLAFSEDYVLAGAGLQGFYQTSAPDDVWTFSYPDPLLDVQLVRRGPPFPEIVVGDVRVSWELDPKTGLTGGATARKGIMKPLEDAGFRAAIPVSAMRTDGVFDPYPVVRLRAEDGQGRILAESAAVLAVSPGFGCALCHANAGTAILEAHDRHQATELMRRHGRGEVIDCRSCHGGPLAAAGEGSGSGKAGPEEPTDGKNTALNLSAAVHGWHAPYLLDREADACETCHVDRGRTKADDTPKSLFARDFHRDRGLSCVRCHGFMEDHSLALLKAELKAGREVASSMAAIPARAVPLDLIEPRLPWVQEPDCTSCHNFSEKPNLLTASAFNKWTPAEEGENGLFSRRRDDMLMARCIICHGAPHAVYPASNPLVPELDDLQPLQYQQQAATLGAYGNCALCHGQSMDFSAHHPLVTWSKREIVPPPGAAMSMPAARFSHAAHTPVVNCTVCHHTGYEDGKSLLCTASGCHDDASPTEPFAAGEEKGGSRSDPQYFRRAFHGGWPSCLACHTQALAEGRPAGPTACKACHQAPSSRWAAEEEQAPGTEEQN